MNIYILYTEAFHHLQSQVAYALDVEAEKYQVGAERPRPVLEAQPGTSLTKFR